MMLTIFSTPKPWHGHINVIQRNALKNWKTLGYEVVLYCDEEGTAEAAKEFDCRHVKEVQKSSYGTPIIGHIFKDIQLRASHDLLMYVNTDIIFASGLKESIPVVNDIGMSLTVGTRLDVDVNVELDANVDLNEIIKKATPHNGTGIDYFIYRKGMFMNMPPFILGRGFWDTWLPAQALSDKFPLVNSSDVIVALHQNHDYSHLPKNAPMRGRRDKWYSKGPETDINSKLRSNMSRSWKDATHVLKFVENKLVYDNAPPPPPEPTVESTVEVFPIPVPEKKQRNIIRQNRGRSQRVLDKIRRRS